MFHYIWWQFSTFKFWKISWQSPFNSKLPFPPFWVTSSTFNSLSTQSVRILLARMNNKKSRLSEQIGRYLQPWIPIGLLVLSARLMKHETLARRGWEAKRIQRAKKGEKMVWNRLMKKKRLYMNTMGGSITKEQMRGQSSTKHDTRVMANKPGKHVTVFFFLTN